MFFALKIFYLHTTIYILCFALKVLHLGLHTYYYINARISDMYNDITQRKKRNPIHFSVRMLKEIVH